MVVLLYKTFMGVRVTERGIGIKVVRNVVNASKTTKCVNCMLEVLMKLQGRACFLFGCIVS